jgi:hypothetical protein
LTTDRYSPYIARKTSIGTQGGPLCGTPTTTLSASTAPIHPTASTSRSE